MHSTKLADIICRLKHLTRVAENLASTPSVQAAKLEATFRAIAHDAINGVVESTFEQVPT